MKPYLLVLAMLCMLVLSLVGAMCPIGHAEVVLVTETRITTASDDQFNPTISGNRILWNTPDNQDHDETVPKYVYYNQSLTTTTPIPLGARTVLTPTLDGDIVVWTDYQRVYEGGQYSYYDVYMYNFTSGVEAPVCNENGWQDQADVDGTRVVWTDGQRDIYLRDVSSPTSVKQQITTDPADQQHPAIHGNIIVWEDYRNEFSGDGNSDIYAYNLATSTEIPICTNSTPQTHPAVYGNTIVWRDERHGGGDIYMYDLITSTETRITTVTSIAPCELTVPAIYDTLIVWTDYRNGNPDIYLYDLDTQTEAPVCTDPATQASAAIYENRVVWTDDRHGHFDIYMGEITILNKPASAKHLLEELQDEIDALSSTDLKPPSTDRQADLRAKIDAIIAKINAGQYQEALNKLTKDILPKLDSDANQTWLLTNQPDLLTLINDIIDYLEALL